MTMFEYDPIDYPWVFNEALRIVTSSLRCQTRCLHIFSPVFRKFPSSISPTDDLLYQNIVNHVTGTKISYGVKDNTHMLSLVMEKIIFVNPTYFAIRLGHPLDRSRALNFLTIKVLHEVAHLLTPVFVSLASIAVPTGGLPTTPPRIGTILSSDRRVIGDCGFGVEEELLGGRLVLRRMMSGAPFNNALVLLKMYPHPDIGETLDHDVYQVADDFLDSILNYLRGTRDSVEKFLPSAHSITSGGLTDARKSKKRKHSKHIISPFVDHEDVDSFESDDDTNWNTDYLVQAGLVLEEELDTDVAPRKT